MMENGKYNLAVYGLDKVGLPEPETIDAGNFKIVFEKYKTENELFKYDGIILFQGIFESYSSRTANRPSRSAINLVSDYNELHKRIKQVSLLKKNGGFICCLMINPIDYGQNGQSTDTDLSKVLIYTPHITTKKH